MNSEDQWIEERLTPDDVWRHRITKILAHCQTPFQEMFVVEGGVYGKALVLDDRWQTCTGDEFLYHEPLVHIPCVMHGDPRRLLIAGGADGGAAREALKWKNLQEILLVDIDGAAVEACRQWLPEIHQGSLDDPRVRIEIGDAFDFIQNERNWDVIIADLTDPIESGPAYKLFTQEFFQACLRALAPGGTFINQAGSLSPPLIEPLARVTRTIGTVFRDVRVIGTHVPTYGSPWGLVLASDKPFDPFPDPVQIDRQLQQSTTGSLRMLDGKTILGMLQTPKYVRDKVTSETVVYTLSNPPQLFR
jgi:spermidine synthase